MEQFDGDTDERAQAWESPLDAKKMANEEGGQEGKPKKATKQRKTPAQMESLERAFDENKYLNLEQCTALCEETGLTYSQIQMWFGHKRQRLGITRATLDRLESEPGAATGIQKELPEDDSEGEDAPIGLRRGPAKGASEEPPRSTKPGKRRISGLAEFGGTGISDPDRKSRVVSSTKAELEAELAMLDSKREALKERERWLTAEYGEQAVPSRFGALSGGMDEQEEPKPERRRPGPKVSAIKSAVMTSATAAEAGRSERVVAAIALVERNIEGGIRQDGPPLGVRFDPIPKDPWVGFQKRRVSHKSDEEEEAEEKPAKVVKVAKLDHPKLDHPKADRPALRPLAPRPPAPPPLQHTMAYPVLNMSVPPDHPFAHHKMNHSTFMHGAPAFQGPVLGHPAIVQGNPVGMPRAGFADQEDDEELDDELRQLRAQAAAAAAALAASTAALNAAEQKRRGGGMKRPLQGGEEEASRIEKKRKSDEGLLSKEEERRRAFLKRELERQALAERKQEEAARREALKRQILEQREQARLEKERVKEAEREERDKKREEERKEREKAKEEARVEKERIREAAKEATRKAREEQRAKVLRAREAAKRAARQASELMEDEVCELQVAAKAQGLNVRMQLEYCPDDDITEDVLYAEKAGEQEGRRELKLRKKAAAEEGGASVGYEVTVAMNEFPPQSVGMRSLLTGDPWDGKCEAPGELFMVWSFVTSFLEKLGLWPFTPDELAQALHDFDSRLLGEIHISLLQTIVDDIKAFHQRAQAEAASYPVLEGGLPALVTAHPLVERAPMWGFDVKQWEKDLNALTWPEILRQWAICAGLGPRYASRKEGLEEEESDEENGAALLRSGAAVDAAIAQIEGRKARATKAGRCAKGKRQQGKQYKPLTVGTVKYAVFHVLSQAGPAGLTIKEIVAQINDSGLKDMSEHKSAEFTVVSALRDSCFSRVGGVVGTGRYRLVAAYRRSASSMLQKALADVEEEEDEEEPLPGTATEAAVSEGGPLGLVGSGDEGGGREAVPEGEKKDEGKSAGAENGGCALDEKDEHGEGGQCEDGKLREGLERSNGDVNGKEKRARTVLEDGEGGGLEPKQQGSDCEKEEEESDEDVEEEEEEEFGEVVSEGEPFVQALLRCDYSGLSVEERLQGLVALVNAVNETDMIRDTLEERFEATMALRKQLWAERKKQKEGNGTGGEANGADSARKEDPEARAQMERLRGQRAEVLRKSEEQNAIRGIELGRDRRHNRYFFFEATGGGESGPCSGRVYFQSAGDWHWEVLDTEGGLEALLGLLDARGVREAALLENLQRLGPRIRAAMRKNGRGLPLRPALTGPLEGTVQRGMGQLVRPAAGVQSVNRPLFDTPQPWMGILSASGAAAKSNALSVKQDNRTEEKLKAEPMKAVQDLRSPGIPSPSAFSPFGGRPPSQDVGGDSASPFQRQLLQSVGRTNPGHHSGQQEQSQRQPLPAGQPANLQLPSSQERPGSNGQQQFAAQQAFPIPPSSFRTRENAGKSGASYQLQAEWGRQFNSFNGQARFSPQQPPEALAADPASKSAPQQEASSTHAQNAAARTEETERLSGSMRPAAVLQEQPVHSQPFRAAAIHNASLFSGPQTALDMHAQVALAHNQEIERLNRLMGNVGGFPSLANRPDLPFRPVLSPPSVYSPTGFRPQQNFSQPLAPQPLPAGRFSIPSRITIETAMQSPATIAPHPRAGTQPQALVLANASIPPGPPESIDVFASTPVEPPTVFLHVLGAPPEGPEAGALGPARKLLKRGGAEGAITVSQEGPQALARFEEAEQWLWDVKTRAGRILDEEASLSEKLLRCDYCQEVLRPKEERHCEFCHVTHEHTAISVEAWEQHLRQCEEKVQAGDPDWPRFAPLERPPPRIQKLKAELMDVEATIPAESVDTVWMERNRNRWATLVKRAATPLHLLEALAELEGVVMRSSSGLAPWFETTSEILSRGKTSRGNPAPPKEGDTPSVLPWLPHTTAAVALRLMAFDGALVYDKENDPRVVAEKGPGNKADLWGGWELPSGFLTTPPPGGRSASKAGVAGQTGGAGRGLGKSPILPHKKVSPASGKKIGRPPGTLKKGRKQKGGGSKVPVWPNLSSPTKEPFELPPQILEAPESHGQLGCGRGFGRGNRARGRGRGRGRGGGGRKGPGRGLGRALHMEEIDQAAGPIQSVKESPGEGDGRGEELLGRGLRKKIATMVSESEMEDGEKALPGEDEWVIDDESEEGEEGGKRETSVEAESEENAMEDGQERSQEEVGGESEESGDEAMLSEGESEDEREEGMVNEEEEEEDESGGGEEDDSAKHI